eukprot:TRINITY_DN29929_c5_g1_i1.p1 TRINITY_DN29929_c5_g1~~TRINITY_DN29929_c5_g1_i1.p1  ORF type:complete len:1527 (-),score=324.40 TRINITY_DN29929_c5_g1_i1:107-4687(-)
MWMGQASPRCSACKKYGKPGPWCLADRPCSFPAQQGSPASSGRGSHAGSPHTVTRTPSFGRRSTGSTTLTGSKVATPQRYPQKLSGSEDSKGTLSAATLPWGLSTPSSQTDAGTGGSEIHSRSFQGSTRPKPPGSRSVSTDSKANSPSPKMASRRPQSAFTGTSPAALMNRLAHYRAECERLLEENAEHAEEKAAMTRQMVELHLEREQLVIQMAELKAGYDRKLAESKLEMNQKTGAFYAECGRTLEANKKEMERQMAEFQAERERFDLDKVELTKKMEEIRTDGEARLANEEAAVHRRMQELHEDCERKMQQETELMERKLVEVRHQTEEQLRKERQVTDHIMHVLQELPPLQVAMELGDISLLTEELDKWKLRKVLPERFGECKGVAEAVLKLAQERLVNWRGVEQTWKDVLREVENLPGNLSTLTTQSQKIFRTLKESQLTMLDLRRSDPKAVERICEVLTAWQERSMSHSNDVQKSIVRKAVTWPQMGSFDFADLDICLRLVDRAQAGSNQVFLSRAQALVDDERTPPQQLKSLLGHLETMLFFLRYASNEDLAMTHGEFRKLAVNDAIDAEVMEYIRWAEQEYPPGSELVRMNDGRDLLDGKNVGTVLKDLRAPKNGFWKKDGLAPFREIFYQWAVAMHTTFNLLVLPHHTQVVCLLVFQRFLDLAGSGKNTSQALIAQVGTGEGKSVIIAALAIYVAVVLRKKAHVIVDDETLLQRDFATFRQVFEVFEVNDRNGKRALSACLCVSEEQMAAKANDPFLRTRIDADADVCYCEARHVQSFYASIARSEKRDFNTYSERVLILDEVDALVIDEEPNDVFVYPNSELSGMATSVADALAKGANPEETSSVKNATHPAKARVINEMRKEWARGKSFKSGEDYVYSKELGKYCALQHGRVNPKAWSLALDCRNFQDGHTKDIQFQERLFVTSRPRVFRKYHRIIGLSGSIGSKPERQFLKDTYRASFFQVPPFLTTCRNSPFHEAVPVRAGLRKRMVYTEASVEQHAIRIAEIALDARDSVPVLVIARDRAYAEHLVDALRQLARSRGLGALAEDAIRSLSRTLYENNPEQWKENLNRSTMALGDGGSTGKSWRVTVTDPRGGRGVDYRVDDESVDAKGGLLLIPAVVPTSRREWTQFLGRTARQDCKGQFCCVLNVQDYDNLSKKYREPLDAEGADGGLSLVESILRWGDREAAERIRGSAALYNCGVRMNELCETVFSRRSDVLRNRAARERLVDACQRLRWMNLREVDEAFSRLPDFYPAQVPTEACDMGRPAEPPAGSGGAVNSRLSIAGTRQSICMSNGNGQGPAKVVVFCLDWSASMKSNDTGTPLSRFETCIACILRILREQVRDADYVGVAAFGPTVQMVVPLVTKGHGGRTLESQISALRPQLAGGTCFFDAVAQCLQMLGQPSDRSGIPTEARRWLVCLTDGDDLGSHPHNNQGQMVGRLLQNSPPEHLNLLAVTVGPLKPTTVQIIQSWVQRVKGLGGTGVLLSERDAHTIAKAFTVVAEYLAAEVGGAVEC